MPYVILALLLLFLTTPAWAERLLVSNEKDNTITVIDAATLAVTATVQVGDRPRGIVLSKDGRSLYICASDSDHIEVLDLASLTVKQILPSGPDPELFALNPAGDRLYVSNENDSMVSVLDLKEGTSPQKSPSASSPRAWPSARMGAPS